MRALVEHERVRPLHDSHSREAVVDAARRAVERARERLRRGERDVTVGADDVARELEVALRPRLRPVINATGVVLHTNLGRAPLAPEAVARLAEAARYTNLELRLETGERGGRDDGIDAHVRALTGAERAFAVNNCAAATLLVLGAIARGREVIVSRGELVEIGGGFRVPEVLEQSGCRLVEVGTTNRTRAADFERAIRPETGAILKVHRSNFAIVGFTEEASIAELSALAKRHALPLLYDQGTGELDLVRRAIADGADLVTFSGDKLLGGPQAGLVAGRAELVERARRHPLARALRLDKLRFAALEETLALWRSGRPGAVPVARMLAEPAERVRARADRLEAALRAIAASVRPSEAAAGGGTRPGEPVGSYAVSVKHDRAQALAALLRTGEPAVVARVADGAVLLDARTVADEEVDVLAAAVLRAAARVQAGEEASGGADLDDEGPTGEADGGPQAFREDGRAH